MVRVKVCIVFSLLTLVMNSAQPGEASMSNREKTMNKGNRLQCEKSPYLLQHADNPVDWYPWGEEAFEKARKENKPIFLSIGYSTCHWCHVMAHESFEDPRGRPTVEQRIYFHQSRSRRTAGHR